ncbi:hypothetical protein [Parerythrobacter lacustris]|uniref:Helix-turn-helix domain-containing protein n=1 Tax=Parerythrobacter lacustris TaxID=2969984 RepID=A0ABT1XP77_9SPHN|nr:hypothetical protein [Parerythrobacter lacustris]MCR2833465.1 hypothetical protein [Parerythrobacter lacustris]
MKKPSQAEKLRRLLADGAWHSTPEIQQVVYGGDHLGTARIASRVNDLRNKGCEISGRRDEDNRSIYWYRMSAKPKPRVEYVNIGGVMHARVVADG